MSNYANGLPARRVRPRSRLSGQTPLGPLIFLINSLQGCGGRNSPTSAGETGGRQGASPQDWPSQPPPPSSKQRQQAHRALLPFRDTGFLWCGCQKTLSGPREGGIFPPSRGSRTRPEAAPSTIRDPSNVHPPTAIAGG